jgi:MFS family permease
MQRWQINLAVLWFSNFLFMSGMTMIMPFLALYLKSDLGLTDEHEIGVWAGLIFAANFVTSFMFQPIWGKLSDRYGRKVMLLRSGFGMSIVMLLMGFAQTPLHLLLLRVANGVISGFQPAAVALVSANTPQERMGFAMGTIQSGATAGIILGPFFGGLMADHFGYRPIFYITGSLLLFATLLTWALVRESFDRSTAALTPQAGVIKGFRELVRIPQIPVLLTVTLMIQFAMLAPNALLPLYVEKLHGSMENVAFWAGFVSSVTAMSNMASSPLLGRLGDKIGASIILFISLLGAAIMFVPQAFVGSVGELLFWRFMLGIFMGGLVPTVNALLRRYSPDDMISRTFGFNSSAFSLGNMFGPIVGGALSGPIGIEGVFLVSGGLLLATGGWFYFTMARAKPS